MYTQLSKTQLQLLQNQPQLFSTNKKIPFYPEEDVRLKNLAEEHGIKDWELIASHMPGRTPKQCRDRWNNYLVPIIQNGEWTPEQDILLMDLYKEFGPQWKLISEGFPGKTPNAVKNRFCKIRKENPNNIVDWDDKHNSILIKSYNKSKNPEETIYNFFMETGKLLNIYQAERKIYRLKKDDEYCQMFNKKKKKKKEKNKKRKRTNINANYMSGQNPYSHYNYYLNQENQKQQPSTYSQLSIDLSAAVQDFSNSEEIVQTSQTSVFQNPQPPQINQESIQFPNQTNYNECLYLPKGEKEILPKISLPEGSLEKNLESIMELEDFLENFTKTRSHE